MPRCESYSELHGDGEDHDILDSSAMDQSRKDSCAAAPSVSNILDVLICMKVGFFCKSLHVLVPRYSQIADSLNLDKHRPAFGPQIVTRQTIDE